MDQKNSYQNMLSPWSLTERLRSVSIGKKLSIIIVLIVFILLLEFGNFWLSMRIMSSIRGYVGGEGAWSKAQKAATSSLLVYTISSNESDYQTFLSFMQIPIAYKEARIELEKKYPDFEFIRDAWIRAGTDPADVNDAYFLYRNFHDISYMGHAIDDWKDGDEIIQEFIHIGQQVHEAVQTPYNQSNASEVLLHKVVIGELVQKLIALDYKATQLENSFSASLAKGSRAIKNALIVVTAILSLLLGVFSIIIAMFITRIMVRVDQGKTEFISIASHQLNTPLSIMKNAYVMVKDGTITPQQGIEYWGSGLKRMSSVVEDFWSAFKLQQGMKFDIQKNDIASMIDDAVTDKNNMLVAVKKPVTISIENPSFKIPLVMCDIKQISNVVYNLLDNAAAYTSEGSITVLYEIIDGTNLKVKIKDTGIGFSKEDAEKMAKKFYRARRALSSRPDGSGLGLYICKSIIDSNHGKFAYESDGEGKGATFSFTLPIAK